MVPVVWPWQNRDGPDARDVPDQSTACVSGRVVRGQLDRPVDGEQLAWLQTCWRAAGRFAPRGPVRYLSLMVDRVDTDCEPLRRKIWSALVSTPAGFVFTVTSRAPVEGACNPAPGTPVRVLVQAFPGPRGCPLVLRALDTGARPGRAPGQPHA